MKSILVDGHTLLCHVARNLPSLDYSRDHCYPICLRKRFFKRRFSLSRLYRASYRYWQRGNRITLSCIIAMITVAYDAAIVRVNLNKRPKTSAKARCVIAYYCK